MWLDFPINVETKLIYEKYNPIIIPFIINKAVCPIKHVPVFDVAVNKPLPPPYFLFQT